MILNAILATASLCIGAWMLTYEVQPNYTRSAMRAHQQGLSFLEAVVLQDGTVRAARVLHGPRPDFGLDQEAVNAVRQWRFKPGTDGKRPANVVVPIELSFRLK
jgi:periplasmic protein TonB